MAESLFWPVQQIVPGRDAEHFRHTVVELLIQPALVIELLREGTGTRRHLINGARQHGRDFKVAFCFIHRLNRRLINGKPVVPVRSIHVPLFKRSGNGQHDISVLHRFVEELIGADHHFQFFKRFFILLRSKSWANGFLQATHSIRTGGSLASRIPCAVWLIFRERSEYCTASLPAAAPNSLVVPAAPGMPIAPTGGFCSMAL